MKEDRRVYLAVGAAAIVVYVGALWNRFALDDLVIIDRNPVVHSLSGLWVGFADAYQRGAMYRPLTIASYAVDWPLHSFVWYHAVNLVWHAGASILLAALARCWTSAKGAIVAGLVFAVHPVHVEAVANVVGRDELMAAVFALLAVYAALVRDRVGWSAIAFALGLLSKENAAVVPALIAWGWLLRLGAGRPERRRLIAYGVSWGTVAVAYAAVRWTVLRTHQDPFIAPVFAGLPALDVRLTAIAELRDVAVLLLFPATLRMDYGPLERTAVTTLLDARLLLGITCLLVWALGLGLALRRGRTVEAFGLGWIAIAFSPVANLLFPTGILVAERTLYLPSAGLALALGGWFERSADRRWWPVIAAVLLAAAIRTAVRVPVWRDDYTAVMSILEDSPRSYVGPKRMIVVYLDARQPDRALDAARQAIALFPRDVSIYPTAAAAAFAAGHAAAADSLLTALRQQCPTCNVDLQREAAVARQHGYPAAADSLEARARRQDVHHNAPS